MVPLRKNVLKYGTPKPRFRVYRSCRVEGFFDLGSRSQALGDWAASGNLHLPAGLGFRV